MVSGDLLATVELTWEQSHALWKGTSQPTTKIVKIIYCNCMKTKCTVKHLDRREVQ